MIGPHERRPASRAFSSAHEGMDIELDDLLPHRSILYRLFASLFLYPDPERLDKIREFGSTFLEGGLVHRDFPFSPQLQALCERLESFDLEAERRAIVNEYNRLFLIRPKAPPHETFYTDVEGQFRGIMTSELEGEYQKFGLVPSTDLNELPDHVAVELEFLSFLCSKEVSARQAGLTEEQLSFQNSQRAFMQAHLARWFPKFARRVKDAQPEHLYHLVLQAAFAFLIHELDYLGIPH